MTDPFANGAQPDTTPTLSAITRSSVATVASTAWSSASSAVYVSVLFGAVPLTVIVASACATAGAANASTTATGTARANDKQLDLPMMRAHPLLADAQRIRRFARLTRAFV
jgi:hypothetical protein